MSSFPDVVVNRSSPVPLYHQVAEQLERAIRDGELLPGDRIANEVVLADRLGLSRPTLRQAIQSLVDQGLVVRKRGVGTLVVHAPIRRTVELTSLNDDLLRAGRQPSTVVLDLQLQPAPDAISEHLKIVAGTPVWRLDRLRRVAGRPLAVMRNYVPGQVADLGAVDLSATGLYEHFRSAGIHLRVAHQTISARKADAEEARLLEGTAGDPLLTMQRTSFDDQGRAVEFGTHLYRPDLYAFETTLVDR
ncbi:GntR family transcriptional regulator [Nocardioides mesophilus]|uniref:GntR family transcriptional regulator n=1 Tax=Nocardioides mesophilus TaxID=433659 RepID=A0A7G9RDU1_9ACTN|nr:GntR family transcriptional regulator [Nocardioides mesophilus]QNN53766.1 GntR family transcriptional regulator [Nocardioides mesophilus]